jgi:hypothetical protein
MTGWEVVEALFERRLLLLLRELQKESVFLL